MDARWIQVTPSEFPWERDALTFLKERLPDYEPYRAWANFEFLLDGTIGEVDVLVVAPKGVFLVEIKSWPGTLEGDAGTWRLTRPGQVRGGTMDNPLLLANRKAKRLKTLLGRQRAFRGERVPFVAPLVFLSHPELDCRLDASARDGITGLGRDGDEGSAQRGGLSGVIDVLARMAPEEHEALGRRRIDKPMAKRIAQALEEAGVRPSQSSRKVADLELGELLDEGAGYQDFAAVHPRFEHAHRRVRIYGTPDADPMLREVVTRAAQREFELLAPLQHPGIVRALDLHEHELGPALVFERDPSEVRLDHFLAQDGASLTLFDRLALVRDLGETVASAHGRRLYHRALSPRSVLVVRPGTPEQRFCIINWQTGAREGGTLSVTVKGTSHVDQLVDTDAAPYLAPEALTLADADPQLLDVFSLGAIAYHVFTGQPPAEMLAALTDRLQRDGALEVASVLDGAGEYLAEVVRAATTGDATERTSSVVDFLEGLVLVEEELTEPERPSETEEVLPLEAQRGAVLAGYVVDRRLGRGSTAVALLAKDGDDQSRVLKIATDPDRNDRIRDEADVLSRLRDRTIIASFGEPIEVAGHVGIVLAYASEGTLAQRLHAEGRLSLETLERWGEDLLSALSYLEQVGVPHRDIKPENLGIMEVGPRKQRRLVLMDFSLSRAAADQLQAGTRPYLDPFIGPPARPRWDLAGDRFAVAMVLHEMAAGTLPFWGDRRTDPRFTEADVTVDRDALPREIAGSLADLLERALRRNAAERFDTADDMLRAWRRIFERLDITEVTEEEPVDIGAVRAVATRETPLVAIGLSARAVNALERENALTVGDLLALPPLTINTMRGVGLETRRELVDAQRELRGHLGAEPPPPRTTTTGDEPDVQRLDALIAQLVPRKTSRNETEVDAVRRLLGLDELRAAGPWPSQTEVAAALAVTRARVGQIVGKARQRWRKLTSVRRLQDEVVEHLAALGGLAAATEIERAVGADRGADDPDAVPTLARAAVRAAVEAELSRSDTRIAQRRAQGGRVLLASAGEDAAERQRVLDHALRLGDVADELAAAETLAGSAEVIARLRAVNAPAALSGLSQDRIVHLAAVASRTAAASARLELHPRGLPPARAIALGRAALLGADRITPDEVRRRIAARFPYAEPLPDRPALDALLRDAGLELEWDDDQEAFVVPRRAAVTGLTSYESSVGRLATANVTRLPARTDPDVIEAEAFESRLINAQRDGGMLTLMTYPQDLVATGREVRRLGVTAIDVDALLLGQLHAAADDLQVRWDLVLRADAADRSSQDWNNLTRLVSHALPKAEEELAACGGTVLLENLGLLARYDGLGLIDRLRTRIMGGDPLRSCWTLIPADDQTELPSVDGTPVPVLTPNEWARVPRSWLRNVHRAAEQQGVA